MTLDFDDVLVARAHSVVLGHNTYTVSLAPA